MSAVESAVAVATSQQVAVLDPAAIAQLPIPQRVAVLLKSAETELELKELVERHKDITTVTNKDGREQVHRAYMVLKNRRVELQKLSMDARDDATRFGKACIAEEKRLIALIDPEETRLQGVRDAWDEEQERIRQEAIDRERARVAAIDAEIEEIRGAAAASVGRSAEEVADRIREIEEQEITEALFQERHEIALQVRDETLTKMRAIHAQRVSFEAEQARLAEERQRLEEQRKRDEEAAAQRRRDEDARLAEERERLRAEREAQELVNMRLQEVDGIRQQVAIAISGRLGVRAGGTLECAEETLAETVAWVVDEERFGPLLALAETAKSTAILQIKAIVDQRRQEKADREASEAEHRRLAELREKQEAEQRERDEAAAREREESERRQRIQAENDAYIAIKNQIADLRIKAVNAYNSLESLQGVADELEAISLQRDELGDWHLEARDLRTDTVNMVRQRIASLVEAEAAAACAAEPVTTESTPAPAAAEQLTAAPSNEGAGSATAAPANAYPGAEQLELAIAARWDVAVDVAREWLHQWADERAGYG